MTILETALVYHAEGYAVIPLIRGVKAPSIRRWTCEGLREPQTEARVLELFAEHDGNIGIVCGPASRLVGVDVDVKKGAPGLASLAAWEAKHGLLPRTRTHGSPSGGMHKLLRTPPGFHFATSHVMGDGIDVMGTGGQIVAPPSVLVGTVGHNGAPQVPGPYVVIDDAPIADCPPELLALLQARRERGAVTPKKWTPVTEDDPTYAARLAMQRKGFAGAPLYLMGQSEKGVARYVMTFQRLGPGLRLDYETTAKSYAEVYDPRLPVEDRWLPDFEEELLHTIGRAYLRPMDTGYAPDALWVECQAMEEIRGGTTTAPSANDGASAPLPVIRLSAETHKTIDAACAALAIHPNVYQREGHLIQPLKIEGRVTWAREGQSGVPTLREIPTATLAGELTRCAQWMKYDGRKKAEAPCEPPERVVSAVRDAAQWPGVRTLYGIVEAPLLREDGSILQAPGYDPLTRRLFEPGGVVFPSVPDAPTCGDACGALAELLEPFEEFPFAADADLLVPAAVVLTSLAMGALEGCNFPCFLFDANLQGTGKTLAADACSWILTAREVPKQTFPSCDKSELEKILGGAARAATPMLLIDNVNGTFGGDALEQRLTCRGTSQLRVLGRTETETLPWRTIVLASGNNVRTTVDMRRRIVRCRLLATAENPEQRPIKRVDLRKWILANRPRLVVAGLTILRAYIIAGRPAQQLGSMGNFEEWSRLVAGALKWTSGVDVLDARLPDASAFDPVTEAYAACLGAFTPGGGAWVLGRDYSARDIASMPCWDELIPAGDPNRGVRVAGLLRQMTEVPIGGRQLVPGAADARNKVRRFRVVGV